MRPRLVQLAGFGAFAVAGAVGVALSLATDWRLVIVGAAAVLAAYFYTAGPKPYGYVGLGEVFVFCFFGLFATVGTTYVETLQAPPAAWLLGGATGFLASAVLAINNLRDVDTDRVAGKMTLAVRIGRRATRRIVAGFYAAALVLAVLASRFAGLPPLSVLVVAVAPFVVAMLEHLASSEGPILIAALKRSAELELWFALLFTAGVVVGVP